MDKLESIPVKIINHDSDTQFTSNAPPLLHQLGAMLETLTAAGQTDSIDLRRAPLSPKDLKLLKELLGQGEVNATLNALGTSHIRETAISGVWWITHRNTEDKIISEFIEVAEIPEILKSHPDDVRAGPAVLRERMASKWPGLSK